MNDIQKQNFERYIIKNVKNADMVFESYEKEQWKEEMEKTIIKSIQSLYSRKIKLKINSVFIENDFLFNIDLDFKTNQITFSFDNYNMPPKLFYFDRVFNYEEVFLDFITDKEIFGFNTFYLITPLKIKADNRQI